MEVVRDTQAVEQLIEFYDIRGLFDTPDLSFIGLHFQKGEVLYSPLNPLQHLLFLVKGSIQMYDLQPDGSTIPISLLSGFTMIGEREFIAPHSTRFFLEAADDCTFIALPIEPNRTELDKDLCFLHYLLTILSDKFEMGVSVESLSGTLEKRLLEYLRYDAEGHELSELDSALFHLRCSRRQLQRVLKKLCDSGELVKLGKGHYRLEGA
jgi:CRP-like cAMP-binding protein